MEQLNLSSDIVELSDSELSNYNGGVFGTFIAAAGLTLAATYYVGYAIGKLTCEEPC